MSTMQKQFPDGIEASAIRATFRASVPFEEEETIDIKIHADPENYRFHMSVSVPRSPALSTVDDMSAILGQLADGWLHHVGELIAIVATPDRLVACFDVTR